MSGPTRSVVLRDIGGSLSSAHQLITFLFSSTHRIFLRGIHCIIFSCAQKVSIAMRKSLERSHKTIGRLEVILSHKPVQPHTPYISVQTLSRLVKPYSTVNDLEGRSLGEISFHSAPNRRRNIWRDDANVFLHLLGYHLATSLRQTSERSNRILDIWKLFWPIHYRQTLDALVRRPFVSVMRTSLHSDPHAMLLGCSHGSNSRWSGWIYIQVPVPRV